MNGALGYAQTRGPNRKCQNDFVKCSVIIIARYHHHCTHAQHMCYASDTTCTLDSPSFLFLSIIIRIRRGCYFLRFGSFERVWAHFSCERAKPIAKYKITLFRPCTSKHNFSGMKTEHRQRETMRMIYIVDEQRNGCWC